MIRKFIEPANTIILAVCPGNSDLANSEGLNMARTVDPKGERTIGVITKLDIMDDGTDALESLMGKIYDLRLGYVGVVCRGQKDINNNKSIKAHLEDEATFFENHQSYSFIKEQLGIQYLSRRLNEILVMHINDTLPSIKKEIDNMLYAKENELKYLGYALDGNEKTLINALTKSKHKFTRLLTDKLEGKNLNLELFNENPEHKTGGSDIRKKLFDNFSEEVWKIDPIEEIKDARIESLINQSTGLQGPLLIPANAFEILIREMIKKFKRPAEKLLKNVHSDLKKIIDDIDFKKLKRFKHLKTAFKTTADRLSNECYTETEKKITDYFSIESNFINLQHPKFKKSLMLQPETTSPDEDPSLNRTAPLGYDTRKSYNPEVQNFQKSYIIKDIYDSKEAQNIQQPLIKEKKSVLKNSNIQLAKDLMGSYLKILKTNLCDIIPKTIIYFLIHKTQKELPTRLEDKCREGDLQNLFDEPASILKTRRECIDLVEALKLSSEILIELSESS